MKNKLYEINEYLNDSLEQLDVIEDEEEREEYRLAIVEQVKELILQKSNNLLAQNQYYDNFIDNIDNEMKRLRELKKSIERQQNNFKNMVDYWFKEMNIQKVNTDLGTIKYRKAPLSVEIKEEDIQSLPQDYIRVKTEYSADKNAIKDLYKTKGIKLPNVIYNEGNDILSFK